LALTDGSSFSTTSAPPSTLVILKGRLPRTTTRLVSASPTRTVPRFRFPGATDRAARTVASTTTGTVGLLGSFVLKRGGRAARDPAEGLKAQGQMVRRGQPALETGRQAVGRHNIEADAGQQHHARGLCLSISDRQGLKDRDFARDVEVMDLLLQAGVGHRPRGVGERPGAVQDGRHAADAFLDRGRVVQAEDAVLQAKFPGQP
jgi:hypothetical protein